MLSLARIRRVKPGPSADVFFSLNGQIAPTSTDLFSLSTDIFSRISTDLFSLSIYAVAWLTCSLWWLRVVPMNVARL